MTPTQAPRGPSRPNLDIDYDRIDESVLDAGVANTLPDDRAYERFMAAQVQTTTTTTTTKPTTRPDVGTAVEPAAAAERVMAEPQFFETTATTGKRGHLQSDQEKNSQGGRTPRGIVETEGGDETAQFAQPRPVMDLQSSRSGLPPPKQQF
jgi:hypothetical protein